MTGTERVGQEIIYCYGGPGETAAGYVVEVYARGVMWVAQTGTGAGSMVTVHPEDVVAFGGVT